VSDMEPMFASPDWYDRSVNWSARFGREIPVLTEVFGPPGSGGILDAGCGPGRQGSELAACGYDVTALDADAKMLELAARNADQRGVQLKLVHAPYAQMLETLPGGFDGVYCLANSLAAAREREACEQAVRNFAAVLRPGGRLFVQILNFRGMRNEVPCIRGPRVTRHEDIEYVSVRHFTFEAAHCRVTNVTLWKDDTWHHHSNAAVLYPIDMDELTDWCAAAGLRIDARNGSYAREEFDPERSVDLILVATRA